MYEIMSNNLQVEVGRIRSWISNRRNLARFQMKFQGHFRQDATTQTTTDEPTTDDAMTQTTTDEPTTDGNDSISNRADSDEDGQKKTFEL